MQCFSSDRKRRQLAVTKAHLDGLSARVLALEKKTDPAPGPVVDVLTDPRDLEDGRPAPMQKGAGVWDIRPPKKKPIWRP